MYYSLFIYLKLIPPWSVPDWRMEKILQPSFPKLFFSTEGAGPCAQAQLYWAGRTVGWIADQTSQKAKHTNFVSTQITINCEHEWTSLLSQKYSMQYRKYNIIVVYIVLYPFVWCMIWGVYLNYIGSK